MQYLIVGGVLSIMALYALIIARCLKEREWLWRTALPKT
jgi:hypothetical protein